MMKFGIAVILGVFALNSSFASEPPASKPQGCESLLEAKELSSLVSDPRITALIETHSLKELLSTDLSSNLAIQEPWIVMNAPQRILSLIYSEGVREVTDPKIGAGKRKIYSLFSDGVAATGGLRIIGQEAAIEKVVSRIEAAARSERAGLYPALLVGGPGTGKSEFLKILRTALKTSTLKTKSNFVYSYEWRNLEQIPSLRRHLNSIEDGQHAPMACPLHDSPITLLPEKEQDKIVHFASATVEKLIGIEPTPQRKMCPHCNYLHDHVIQYYAAKKGGELTVDELLDALDKHVTIRRVLLGDPGTTPLIAAQGKDVDYASLFLAKNPMEFVQSGSGHPLSYLYTGAILSGNGSVVFLDELGKNPAPLRAKLLNTIQDRSVSEGNTHVDFDALFLAATNTKDIHDILSEDPQSPFVNRLVRIPMNWSIRPEEIVKTLAYELPGLMATKLGDAEAKPVPAQKILDDFVPQIAPGVPVQTSDRRFDVALQIGKDRVHVSPYALMYMADIIALSRMNFDPKAIENFSQYPMVSSPMYVDPVARIKALLGTQHMTQSQASEFWTLSALTKEGSFGISAREVSGWFNEAVSEARKTSNGYCVTPVLLKQALMSLIKDEAIGSTDKERTRLLIFAKIVSENFTIPALRSDIMSAVAGSQNEAVNQIYDEMLDELQARHQDPEARVYVPEGTNQPVQINNERLNQIGEIFKKQTGRPLSISEIAMFHMSQRRINGSGGSHERNRDLISAITSYQATKVAGAHDATLQKVVRVASGRARGSSEEQDLVNQLMGRLEHEHGFCQHCAAKSLELIHEAPAENQKPKE